MMMNTSQQSSESDAREYILVEALQRIICACGNRTESSSEAVIGHIARDALARIGLSADAVEDSKR